MRDDPSITIAAERDNRSYDTQTYLNGVSRLGEVMNLLGFSELRAGQDSLITNVLARKDTYAVLPTSTGKSSAYIIPTLCHDWRTIIISPLLALMQDQVQKLWAWGLSAGQINTLQSEGENQYTVGQWAQGNLQYLFVAPERLDNPAFHDAIKAQRPNLLTVDEVHCLSQWSFSFRPAYGKIGHFVTEYQPDVVLTLTATSTPEIEFDVRRIIGLQHADKIFYYPQRTELQLASEDWNSNEVLMQYLESIDGATIIYCATIKRVEELADAINSYFQRVYGYDQYAMVFHSKLTSSLKQVVMNNFMDDRLNVMVATNAFGLGVDKPNIRSVIHRDAPGSLEALSQEQGRAARDRKPAYCLAFHDEDSFRTQEFFIMSESPSERDVRDVFAAMVGMTDKYGVCRQHYNDIANNAGIQQASMRAIISNLRIYNVIDVVKEKDDTFYFQLADADALNDGKVSEYSDYITAIGVSTEYGMAASLTQLSNMLNVKPTTVKRNLKLWKERGWIEYTAPYTGASYRIVGSIDRVDFDFLRQRLEHSYTKLHKVREYFTVPDRQKHDYLEKYFTQLNTESDPEFDSKLAQATTKT